jgi:TonB family protein
MNSPRMPWPVTRRIILGVACIAVLISSAVLKAQGRASWTSAAVDAKGVRHRGSDYQNGGTWMDDAIKTPPPDYPSAERSLGHAGSGLFRLTLDLKTGAVTKVRPLQSTGFATLDSLATEAFRRWRWKPGKWKEIDVPITFTMRSDSPSDKLPSR